MIVNSSVNLIESTITSDTVGSVKELHRKAHGLIIEVNGTGDFSVRIEMSPNGTDFYSINELDSFTSDAVQSLSDSINVFKFLRAKIDIGSSGSVTKCVAYFKRD